MDGRIESDPSTRSRGLRRAAPALAIVLATVLAYAGSLDAAFQFDDDHVIQTNVGIRGLAAFWEHLAFQMNRPLLFLSFALNYALGGLDPFGYHGVNLLLHLANVALVGWLARVVLVEGAGIEAERARPGAWLAAAIFALHPVATEAVTYVSSRSSLLVTFAYLVSVLAALRAAGRGGVSGVLLRWLCLLSFVAAMATKELALSLPLMLPFVLRVLPWSGGRLGAGPLSGGGGLTAALWGLLIAAVSLRVLTGPVEAPFVTWTLGEHLLTQAGSWLGYLRLALLPVGLNVDHDVPLASAFGPRQALGVVVLVAALAAVVALRRRVPWASFALGWFLIALAPTSLIPLQDHVAERRLYLPMAGAATGLGYALARLAAGARPAALGWGVVAALLVTLGVGTHLRNRVWETPETLWADAARKSPRKARPQARLGRYYLEQGAEQRALGHLDRALALDPDDVAALRDRAALRRARGELEAAAADLERLARVEPERPGPWQSLAEVLLELERPEEALAILRANELREPLQRDTLLAESRAYWIMGQPDRARAAIERSLRRWPDGAREQRALGYLELDLGDRAAARAAFERALELDPGNAEVTARLAEIDRMEEEDPGP